MRRLRYIVLVYAVATPGYAQTPVGWTSIAKLFAERYAQRSPDKFAAEVAEESYDLSGRLRLNPSLSVSLAKTNGENDSESEDMTLTQGTPFGTSLRASRDFSRLTDNGTVDTTRTQSFGVQQKLLKDGPLYGWHTDRIASSTLERGLTSARIDYRKALAGAISQLIRHQSARQSLSAAQAALDRAKEQNTAVKSLVKTGYKAKADILVSEAAEIRARLTLENAQRDFTNSQNDLAKALFQRDQDPPLAFDYSPVPPRILRALEQVSWPARTPEEEISAHTVREANWQADLAWRDDLPDLTLGMTLNRPVDENDAGTTRTYTASISMPLWGVIARDASRRAVYQRVAAEDRHRQIMVATTYDKSSIEEKIRTARSALAATEKIYDLTAQTLKIEQQKYADGKSTVDQLRRTQDDVEQADLAVIQRRTDLFLALLEKAEKAGVLEKVLP